MKGSTVVVSAALLVGAALVLSQDSLLQKVAPRRLSLAQNSQARLLGQTRLLLPAVLTAYTDVGGKSFGAGGSKVYELNEQGSPTKTFQSPAGRASISSYNTNTILIGDLINKRLYTMATGDGSVKPLLDLNRVSGSPNDLLPYSEAMKNGEFSAVASDGKNVFVSFAAGFSSSIYKIDVMSQKVLAHGWASAGDPSAMQFHDGSLFVLVSNGSQIRRFSDTLQKSHDAINLPFGSAKGLGIRSSGEIRTLTRNGAEIAKVSVPPMQLSRQTLLARLDRVRLVQAAITRITFPPLNFKKRYAVLICGDLAENFDGECFWNDTVWMYKTLRNNGYAREDIFVLYGDGADYASANPYYQNPITVTDFAATPAKVNMVLDGLKNGDAANSIPKMDSNDTLFVWTFDHGGLSGGQATLCLRGGVITASNFATKMNAITYAERAVFMQQCYSGGFINGLKNSKTFISTACRGDEVARPADTENEMYGGKSYSHGEFNYHVTTALNRLKTSPPGGAINADSNADTYIASKEMHVWNVGHESRPETPQNNDMGGIGSTFKFKK